MVENHITMHNQGQVPARFDTFPVGSYVVRTTPSTTRNDDTAGEVYLVTNGKDDINQDCGNRCINLRTGKRLKPSWYDRILFLKVTATIVIHPGE